METIALESLVADVILHFCENLAELGCPKNTKDADMWYRYLSSEEQEKVASKLLDIIDRDAKRFSKESKKFERAAEQVTKRAKKFIKTIERAHKNASKSKLVFKGEK